MAGSKRHSKQSPKTPSSSETEYPAILRSPKTPPSPERYAAIRPPPEKYAAIRKDWDTTPLSSSLRYAKLLTVSPWIPSPMADTTAKERQAATTNGVANPVAQLFRSANSARTRARTQPKVLGDLRPIRELINEVEERALYYVCNAHNLEHHETYKTQAYEDSDDESEAMTVHICLNGRFNVVKLPCTIHLGIMRRVLHTPRSPARPGFSNRRLGAAVRFYALRNRRTGVVGQFVANDVHENFLVNDVIVPPSTVIGPLSDFSVIRVGSDVAFWWQNRQGLDYKPSSEGDPRPSDDAVCPDKKPGPKSPKRPNDDDDGTNKESGPRAKKPRSDSDPRVGSSQNVQTSASSPQSWEEMFESGYARCYDSWMAERNKLRATKQKDPKAKGRKLSRDGGWDNMSVINAIATIWASLEMRHGYGTSQVFEIRDRDMQVDWQESGDGQQSTVCGQYSDTFIIPLYFMSVEQEQNINKNRKNTNAISNNKGKGKAQLSPEHQMSPKSISTTAPLDAGQTDSGSKSRTVSATTKPKGKAKAKTDYEKTEERTVGHFVLAVATKADSKPIPIHIWDSRPGTVASAEIEQAARGVVTYSGWMGMSHNNRVWDHDPPLEFRRTAFEKTPNQGRGNFCGLYIVLNAWAYMLGIKVAKKSKLKLPKEKTLENFHQRAIDIVELALAGHMDSRTIQAFLKVYGYSVGQRLEKLVEDVQATKMDDDILYEYVTNKKLFDDADKQKQAEPYAGPWLW